MIPRVEILLRVSLAEARRFERCAPRFEGALDGNLRTGGERRIQALTEGHCGWIVNLRAPSDD